MVVHHDAEVDGIGPIAALRAFELPDYIPLLDAAIEACDDLVVNIELKELPGEASYDAGYPLARLVAQLVADHGFAGRVIVSSFDLLALDAAVAAGVEAGRGAGTQPGLHTGWLTPSWFDQMSALRLVIEGGHGALHPHHDAVTTDLVTAAHEAGIMVTAWTADEPAEIRRLADAGVDAIISNVPDIARSALAGPAGGCP